MKDSSGLYLASREAYDRVEMDQAAGKSMFQSSSCYVYFLLLFATSFSGLICAQTVNVSVHVEANAYDCSTNLICLGSAHKYPGDSNGLFAGRLSLIQGEGDGALHQAGLAYYNKPARMSDPSTQQAASFNTSFYFNEFPDINQSGYYLHGDGMTFVISADNSSVGHPNTYLGIYGLNATNDFKSVVVEFDNYLNQGGPAYNISSNHVSLDFMELGWVAAANASDVNVVLGEAATVYAWVEYSAEEQKLEVRVSNSQSRPIHPLLNYTGDLFPRVEEYMWIGFSSSTRGQRSDYYIREWTFEAYGLPPARKVRSKVGLIVGISIGAPILLVILGILVVLFVRRRDPRTWLYANNMWYLWGPSRRAHPTLQLAGMLEGYRLSYKHLSVATGGFSDAAKLGQGGFGSVYRGLLSPSGIPVAVKKINRESNQGEREFLAKVSIISQLRHRNLIQLLGWCDDKGEYLIVYELMPNGSLDRVLFGPVDPKNAGLSWRQRFNIVTGTAAALAPL